MKSRKERASLRSAKRNFSFLAHSMTDQVLPTAYPQDSGGSAALRHVTPRILERALPPSAAKIIGLHSPRVCLTLTSHVNHWFTLKNRKKVFSEFYQIYENQQYFNVNSYCSLCMLQIISFVPKKNVSKKNHRIILSRNQILPLKTITL